MGKYDDIINLPHHQSITRAHMPMRDRAAQFAPFAALRGYDDEVIETARLTDRKIVLDENEISKIDGVLQLVMANIKLQPEIRVTHFVKDDKKSGGAYITTTGRVKNIDEYDRKIVFTNRVEIQIEDILTAEIL
ncbi:MAG: hypothetical protein PUD72_04095 [Oscillospiraceae bacterium]|nr:hypothetical protein [Oscillospiraceae bacterium]